MTSATNPAVNECENCHCYTSDKGINALEERMASPMNLNRERLSKLSSIKLIHNQFTEQFI